MSKLLKQHIDKYNAWKEGDPILTLKARVIDYVLDSQAAKVMDLNTIMGEVAEFTRFLLTDYYGYFIPVVSTININVDSSGKVYRYGSMAVAEDALNIKDCVFCSWYTDSENVHASEFYTDFDESPECDFHLYYWDLTQQFLDLSLPKGYNLTGLEPVYDVLYMLPHRFRDPLKRYLVENFADTGAPAVEWLATLKPGMVPLCGEKCVAAIQDAIKVYNGIRES